MLNSLNQLNSLNIKSDKEFKEFKKNLKEFQNQIICTSLYFQIFDEEIAQHINTRRSNYFNIASNIAQNSNMFQKHGAIIIHKKSIISSGCNMYCNSGKVNYSMHAEIIAINNALKKKYKDILNNCELYVVRIGPNNSSNILKYSKPCINCQKYICKFNIKKIFYSTNYDYDKLHESSDSD